MRKATKGNQQRALGTWILSVKRTTMVDVNAVIPICVAGDQIITKIGYTIADLPDLHSAELLLAGKPPVYYWLLNTVRLARNNGDQGDYKLRVIYLVGIRGEGNQEVGSGFVGFSTSAAPPVQVLQEMHEEFLYWCRDTSDKCWGWRIQIASISRSAPIVSNTMTITNPEPNAVGSVPTTGNSIASGGSADGLAGPPRPSRVVRAGSLPRIISTGKLPIVVSPLTAIRLKADFQQFWEYLSPYLASLFLDSWCNLTINSKIDPMMTVVRMRRNHRTLLMNWLHAKGKLSSGAVEGLTNIEKLTTRKAKELRTFHAAEIAIYHVISNLLERITIHRSFEET